MKTCDPIDCNRYQREDNGKQFMGFEHIGFTGQRTDYESGNIHSPFREYDPLSASWTTEDPIKDGELWYAYVGNNPVMRIDPAGLATRDEDGNWWFDGNLNLYELSESDRNDSEAGKLAGYKELDEAYESYVDLINQGVPSHTQVKINENLSMRLGDLKQIHAENDIVIEYAKKSQGHEFYNFRTMQTYTINPGKMLLNDGFMSWDEAYTIALHDPIHWESFLEDPIIHWNVRYVLNDWDEINKLTKKQLQEIAKWGNENQNSTLNEASRRELPGLTGKWRLYGLMGTAYHGDNLKLCTDYGRELVITRIGEIVRNPYLLATFNFIAVKGNGLHPTFGGHYGADMAPYEIWGNTPTDYLAMIQ